MLYLFFSSVSSWSAGASGAGTFTSFNTSLSAMVSYIENTIVVLFDIKLIRQDYRVSQKSVDFFENAITPLFME